jgi:hypothetical protein
VESKNDNLEREDFMGQLFSRTHTKTKNFLSYKNSKSNLKILPKTMISTTKFNRKNGFILGVNTMEKRTRNIDDLANAKLILTIFPDYILPLAGAVSHDSVSRYFEYTMVTVYLPKGICAVRAQQDKITMLKFNDFNLGDRKNHNMLAPYKYLTKTKGKNLKIIPQPWKMNLMQSTLLNVMKIPHFGRH